MGILVGDVIFALMKRGGIPEETVFGEAFVELRSANCMVWD